VGFIDDYKKLKVKKGISAKAKMSLLILSALIAVSYLYFTGYSTELELPFFKNISPELGFGFIIFATIVIIATSNSVNLTDGLDGLAIGPIITSSIALLVLSYITGHSKIAQYLGVSFVDGVGELAIICGAMVGAGIGFLWYNTYPAQVFMGDVGSLSLGSMIGIIAVLTKSELLLLLIGGVFVIEALSVIIQVGFFKITGGKRILHMAPLHHHYELKGWAEPKIIVRFWIISIILALFALGTLKLR
jgi:phospho-N-acetylmuramoyl-pentapeptide-transferase